MQLLFPTPEPPAAEEPSEQPFPGISLRVAPGVPGSPSLSPRGGKSAASTPAAKKKSTEEK